MNVEYKKQAEDYLEKPKTWDDIEEDEPTIDEIETFSEYNSNKSC